MTTTSHPESSEPTPAAQPDRPARDIPDNVRNVLVIMTDQHRTDTIGCLGNPHARTPVIDAMGETGFAFTNCFTPTAICTPARASLLTPTPVSIDDGEAATTTHSRFFNQG